MRIFPLGLRTRIFGGNGVLVLMSLAPAGFGAFQLMSIDAQVGGMTALSEDTTLLLRAGQQLEQAGRMALRFKMTGEESAAARSRDATGNAGILLTNAGLITASADRRNTYAAVGRELTVYRTMQDNLTRLTKALAIDKTGLRDAGDSLSAATSKLIDIIQARADPITIAAADAAEAAILSVRIASWQFIATNDPKGQAIFKTSVEKASDVLASLGQLGLNDTMKARLTLVKMALEEYNSGFIALSADALRSDALFDGEMQPLMDHALAELHTVEAAQQNEFDGMKTDTRAAIARTVTLQEIIGVLALVLGTAVAWVVGRSISRPIGIMTSAMTRLAGGDTLVVIPSTDARDEMGAMAKAVEVFRRNAVERKDIELREKQ